MLEKMTKDRKCRKTNEPYFAQHLQEAAARCTYERTDGHIEISRSALMTVETLFIVRQSNHFS